MRTRQPGHRIGAGPRRTAAGMAEPYLDFAGSGLSIVNYLRAVEETRVGDCLRPSSVAVTTITLLPRPSVEDHLSRLGTLTLLVTAIDKGSPEQGIHASSSIRGRQRGPPAAIRPWGAQWRS